MEVQQGSLWVIHRLWVLPVQAELPPLRYFLLSYEHF
jgi:hypothetical protein